MALIVAVDSLGEPNFEIQALADSVIYTLELRWNVRAAAWFLNLWDADGTVLIQAGQRIVVDFPLFTWSRHAVVALPPGTFSLVDTTGKRLDPDFASLGTTCQLLYTPVAELGA